jgi:hypothetical protein
VKRPTSSYLIAIFAIIMATLALVQTLFFSEPEAGRKGAAIVLLVLGLVFSYYVIPYLDLREDRLVVVNPILRHEIGLGAIEYVDTRYALNVGGDFGKVSAWAAPAPGRLRHRSHSTEDFRTLNLKDGANVRPSDLPSTISGSYALMIKRALEKPRTNKAYTKSINRLGVGLIVLPALAVIFTQLT